MGPHRRFGCSDTSARKPRARLGATARAHDAPGLAHAWTGLALVVLLGATPVPTLAQLISLRPVPVAAGDQFLTFPSARLGMAGLSIAVDDPFGDPFANPAKLVRLNRSFVFAAPVSSMVSHDDDGGVRTLPAGLLLAGRDWFGGLTGAVQRVQTGSRTDIVWPGATPAGAPIQLADVDVVNGYGYAIAGHRIGIDLAVAASASYANLRAIDGVDLMYPLSRGVEQHGYVADVRLGALADLGSGALAELMLLHDRFDVRHDVTYLDWRWDESTQQPLFTTRVERNIDHTDTWGVHAGYRRPIHGTPWRAGAILTVNRKWHRGLPDYGLPDIPRDPGTSWAYDIGVGFARVAGASTIGIDLVYEPIRSRTHSLALDTIRTAGGRLLEAGDVTADNTFSFNNAVLRAGIGQETQRFGLQLGLLFRSIRYDLERDDRLAERLHRQREHWLEWTPTWGAALKFPDLEIRYAGRLTTGTGDPSMHWRGAIESLDDSPVRAFIAAPAGPLTVQQARVTTHQLLIAVPLGR